MRVYRLSPIIFITTLQGVFRDSQMKELRLDEGMHTSVDVLDPPLAPRVTTDKLLNLSGPQSPSPLDGVNNVCLPPSFPGMP